MPNKDTPPPPNPLQVEKLSRKKKDRKTDTEVEGHMQARTNRNQVDVILTTLVSSPSHHVDDAEQHEHEYKDDGHDGGRDYHDRFVT